MIIFFKGLTKSAPSRSISSLTSKEAEFQVFIIVISIIISTLMMTTRYKGGSEVLESERVKVHHRGGRHALSIKKVNIDDNGVHNDDVNIDDDDM